MIDKVACRTPAEGRDGVTNIPAWKFDACRRAILETLGEGNIRFSQLAKTAGQRLSDDERANLGSLGWHMVTVKLELEVRGEIARLNQKGPQVLTMGTA